MVQQSADGGTRTVDPQVSWSQREMSARAWRTARRRQLIRRATLGGLLLALLLIVLAVVLFREHSSTPPAPESRSTALPGISSNYRWEALHASGGAPDPRSGAISVGIGSRLLVFGGFRTDGRCCLSDLSAFDLSRSRWVTLASGPAHAGGSFVWDGSAALVFGGTGSVSGNWLWTYNPLTNQWQKVTTSGAQPASQGIKSAVWDGKEVIVLADSAGASPTGTVWIYTPSTRVWSHTRSGNSTEPGSFADARAVWDGQELLVTFANTGTFAFDPVMQVWRSLSPDELLRVKGNLEVWDGAEILSIGGTDPSGAAQTDLWAQAATAAGSWNWTDVGPVDPGFGARSNVIGAWIGNQVLLFGGTSGHTTNNDLWSLRPLLSRLVVSASSDHGSTLQPLDTPSYTIVIQNIGTAPARQVQASLFLPVGAIYQGGSTARDGINVPDPMEGRSALQDGLKLGSLAAGARTELTISLQVPGGSADGSHFGISVRVSAQGVSVPTGASIAQRIAIAPTVTDTPVPPTTTPIPTVSPTVTSSFTPVPTATVDTRLQSVIGIAAHIVVGNYVVLTATVEPRSTTVPSASATHTPSPSVHPVVTPQPGPSSTPSPQPASKTPIRTAIATRLPATTTPLPTDTTAPTLTAAPTSTLVPTLTALSTSTFTPIPTHTPRPTRTPVPTRTPKPTHTPIPTRTPRPTATPSITRTPVPTVTPSPTSSPTLTPTHTPTVAATITPVPTTTPIPTVLAHPATPATAVRSSSHLTPTPTPAAAGFSG